MSSAEVIGLIIGLGMVALIGVLFLRDGVFMTIEATQEDRDLRSSVLKFMIEALERGCSDGDMPDDRELDVMFARHRIAAYEKGYQDVQDERLGQ